MSSLKESFRARLARDDLGLSKLLRIQSLGAKEFWCLALALEGPYLRLSGEDVHFELYRGD